MKIRRRSSQCLNCLEYLDNKVNYCPNCGQENTTPKVSFVKLFSDFFQNYFTLDSRAGRSIVPFLIKPGSLTKYFIEGKRVGFIHPVRLYIFMSFFYFLFLAMQIEKDFGDKPDFNKLLIDVNDQDDDNELNVNNKKADSIFQIVRDKTDSNLSINAELQQTLQFRPDLPTQKKIGKKDKKESDVNIIRRLVKVPGMTEPMVLDSLGKQDDFGTQVLVKFYFKFKHASLGDLLKYGLSKISIIMFFVLPLFALLLKIFYIRRNKLYIEHLIMTLHLHSFVYFILTVALIVMLISKWGSAVGWAIFIQAVYAGIAFKNVYGQSWSKTIVKMCLIGVVYLFILLSAFIIGLFLSLMI